MSELVSTNDLKSMLADARGGLRCAALLALASRDALDEPTAGRLVQDSHGPSASTAALWLTKHRGSSLVIFVPPPSEFSQEARVNLERTLKPSDIRYTLDGSEPTAASPIYQGQTLVFAETTTLKGTRNWLEQDQTLVTVPAAARAADPRRNLPQKSAGQNIGSGQTVVP